MDLKKVTATITHMFIIKSMDRKVEIGRKVLNLLLLVSSFRAIGILLMKAGTSWVNMNGFTGLPVNVIDVVAVITFPTLIFLVEFKKNQFWGYVYLVVMFLANGSNLFETFLDVDKTFLVLSLMVPTVAASFITRPIMSFIFSLCVAMEYIFFSRMFGIPLNIPLILTFIFIGFLGFYTYKAMEFALKAAVRDEKRYIKLVNQLEERVENEVQNVMKAREELARQEKLAFLGKFIQGIGHDLRNPLAAISNSIYFLKNQPISNEKVKKHLQIIEIATGKTTGYINGLLDYLRPSRTHKKPENLNRIIQDTLLTMNVPETIKVVQELKDDLPSIHVDPLQIQRSIENIIINAVQAITPNDGMITIRTLRDNENIIVQVDDTGVGIPPSNLSKLFDPFFTTKKEGTGLGLSVVKEIIELHDGTVDMKSKLGKGTQVTLTFPVTARSKSNDDKIGKDEE
ncbi:MAG: sensor histidine kinase [Candidatus Hodarchaeota archaeon]